MSEIKNPHDIFFKETLSKKENAKSFLENYLPKQILELVDLSHIEIEKDSFVTKDLQEYFSDLLYKVSFQGQEGYVYILFEHKSYQETWVSLQLLEYMVQCWKLKKQQKQKLPVIIPLVIYHGKDTWNIGNKLSDILEYKDERLIKYVPDFEYILHDLTGYRDEDLAGIANLRVMLHLLKYIKSPQLMNKLAQILGLLAQELDKEYLITITIYVLSTTEVPLETFVQMVKDNISKKGGELAMSTLQKLIEKNKIEGKIEGKIEMALELKFGTAGLSLMNRIRDIKDIEKLTQIQDHVKKAKTLEEVIRYLE